jgi:ABC-type multidrug transport system ATPase subunit
MLYFHPIKLIHTLASTILSINGLSKNYGMVQALKQVSFDVPQGSVFGILGPNGSGKTTLLSIILDIIKASKGSFSWFGQEGSSSEVRKQFGTLLETPNFYHYLSAEQNLRINAAIKEKGADEIDQVLKTVGLYERKGYRFTTFSLGMKQRLAIAAALLGNPDVLVLDEPTNGLDPTGIAEIRNLIRELARQGKTIIMASHLLYEVEQVCTHVAILKKGNLLTAGSVAGVLSNNAVVELSAANLEALQNALQSFGGGGKTTTMNGMVELEVKADGVDLAAINQHCHQQGVVLNHLMLKKQSLESKFIEITNQ